MLRISVFAFATVFAAVLTVANVALCHMSVDSGNGQTGVHAATAHNGEADCAHHSSKPDCDHHSVGDCLDLQQAVPDGRISHEIKQNCLPSAPLRRIVHFDKGHPAKAETILIPNRTNYRSVPVFLLANRILI